MPIANLDTVDVVGLVASAVSIALAVFAIWQASTFYRWSDTAAKESSNSARDMRASVERIEKLFDTFYSDTFGLMKETYADFRKHTWAGGRKEEEEDLDEAVQRAAGEKIQELRRDLRADLARVTERGEKTDAAIEGVRKELSALLDRAIDQSRQVEAEVEEDVARRAVRDRIEELRERNQARIRAVKFARPFMRSGIVLPRVFQELYKLREEGEIDFEIDTDRDPPRMPEADALITFSFE